MTPIIAVKDKEINKVQQVTPDFDNKNSKSKLVPNSLDWYELTETSSYILNTLIAYTATARFEEEKKQHPDKEKIEYFLSLYEEVYEVNRDHVNFQSLDKMKEIITHYSPILQAFHA